MHMHFDYKAKKKKKSLKDMQSFLSRNLIKERTWSELKQKCMIES